MTPPTLHCARWLRDGGIDALAALDDALNQAIAGLAPAEQAALKQGFARVMSEVLSGIVQPALAAFPELTPDQAGWAAVARTRARERAAGQPG